MAKRVSIKDASEELASRCPQIAHVLERTGPLRWRKREGGYPGLARIVIEQQLSVASANAILGRVQSALGGLAPEAVQSSSEEKLRSFGLSRPKIRYLKHLADETIEGRIDYLSLETIPEEEAADRLCGLLGVGRWTAAVYLLFCAGRRDLWPRGDVALLAAHKMAGGAFERQDIKDFDAMAEELYAPHRGIAAHLLWGLIAAERGRAPL